MALDFRDDFPSPTLAEWQAQVEKDLQARRYEDLFWHTDEGFVVEPVATGEGIELPHMRKELAALLRPRRQGPVSWQGQRFRVAPNSSWYRWICSASWGWTRSRPLEPATLPARWPDPPAAPSTTRRGCSWS